MLYYIILCYIILYYIIVLYYIMGAKGDWDFRIYDLVKNPDATDI